MAGRSQPLEVPEASMERPRGRRGQLETDVSLGADHTIERAKSVIVGTNHAEHSLAGTLQFIQRNTTFAIRFVQHVKSIASQTKRGDVPESGTTSCGPGRLPPHSDVPFP